MNNMLLTVKGLIDSSEDGVLRETGPCSLSRGRGYVGVRENETQSRSSLNIMGTLVQTVGNALFFVPGSSFFLKLVTNSSQSRVGATATQLDGRAGLGPVPNAPIKGGK